MNKKEYERVYHLNRYHVRRAEAIEILGGKCAICGSTEKLELDHIDPTTKGFDLARCWSLAYDKYIEEINKCQLLCEKHHLEKTIKEQKTRTHGTISMYRKEKCRCALCVKVNGEYQKKYSQQRKTCPVCKKRVYKPCNHAGLV